MNKCIPVTPTKKNNNQAITKSVHRRIEQPAKCGAVYSNTVGCCNCCCGHPATSPPGQQVQEACKERSEKYKAPQLNSIKNKICEIQALQAQPPPHFQSVSDLTPRSKAAIIPKITKKLNFNAGQTVYKNLIPINVNDSMLLPKNPTSFHNKYKKTSNKIPAPELCDFLDPLPPLEHVIPEPDIKLQFPERKFDYYANCLRLFE